MKSPPPGSGHRLLREYLKREAIKHADFALTIKVTASALSQYIAEKPEERMAPRAVLRDVIEIETRGEVPAAAWETEADRASLRDARARAAKEARAAGGSR